MCGIAGFINVSPARQDRPLLERMTDAIAHRGPDDCGFYQDPQASLGHRRLSIIDLAGGHQPMCNEDGSLWIVYNGEIFNHASLRPELEQAGHVYQSHCDSEMILHAYEQYGADCVLRFRGMFAFAIWDKQRGRLFCARDRLGIKPLYYVWNGKTFLFGSEIKALLAHPSVTSSLDENALPEYLALGYLSGPGTMFRGVRKLMPGHTLLLDTKAASPQPQIQQYWDAPAPGTPERRSDHDWIAECRQRLEETVRMRLMSDVPLGMFLSGGVDSSAIAALMKRMVDGPVKSFSVGYSEQEYSELPYAAEVSRAIGTEHHEVVIGSQEFFDALPRLVWHEDEPITWPSSVSLHFVSALASRQVKVVLTGEGSDELFGGYTRYRWTRLNLQLLAVYSRLMPSAVRNGLQNQLASSSLLSASLRRKLGHTFLGCGENIESLYLDNFYSAFHKSEERTILKQAAGGPYEVFLQHWNARPQSSLLARMLYADQKTYLLELLMKQDQMSMSTSIESRVPFLDHTFVEFAARVPDSLKIRGSVQKYIFKKAVADLLPHNIVHRTKMGFPTPLRQWLREPVAAPLLHRLTEKDGFLAGYLDMPSVQAIVDQHRSGSHDMTDRLWRLLNLQIWGDVFLSGRHDLRAEALSAPALS